MKKLTKKIRQNICKRQWILIPIIILVLIIFTSQGCSGIKYEIIIEKTLDKEDYSDFIGEDSEELSAKSLKITNKYIAQTIIRSTDKSIWFIDNNGSFQFIRADKIQIIEIE